MVTFTGEPGIGKTRVAVDVARRIVDMHPSRAAFVDLAAVADADPGIPSVQDAVATALGLEPPAEGDAFDAVLDELRRQSAFIVLDTCEHVIDAAASLVERLLTECRWVSVIATSQRPLAVTAEQVTRVPPLSLPDAGTTSPERALAESEAVALFCTRASALSAFTLNAEILPAVLEICRRLEGNALAIELAAERSPVIGVQDMVERLDQRFSLLTRSDLYSPHRHRSLRAAIDWSYGLLSEREAMLLRRMSVFVGAMPRQAVIDVAGEGIDFQDASRLLNSLVTRSLVSVLAETYERPALYRLGETIRAYARDRLRESGEAAQVRARHARWCAANSEAATGERTGDGWRPEGASHLDELETGRPGGPADDTSALTVAEGRVAEMVADGMTTRRISERLGLSERTVDAHVARVLSKLGLKTRRQLKGHDRTRGS